MVYSQSVVHIEDKIIYRSVADMALLESTHNRGRDVLAVSRHVEVPRCAACGASLVAQPFLHLKHRCASLTFLSSVNSALPLPSLCSFLQLHPGESIFPTSQFTSALALAVATGGGVSLRHPAVPSLCRSPHPEPRAAYPDVSMGFTRVAQRCRGRR